jgi:hypothetical protein
LQDIDQILIRFPDSDGPEAGLPKAVLFKQPHRDCLEALDQGRKASGKAMVYTQLINHQDLSMCGPLCSVAGIVSPV